MKDHQWVKIEVTPVHVMPGSPGDEPIVFVDPEDQWAAEMTTQYGCGVCSTPLNADTVNTHCPSDDELLGAPPVDLDNPREVT